MIDYPRAVGNVNEFMIDIKVPDTLITDTLCSLKLPKPVQKLRAECHEGYLIFSIALQISVITKTIDLELEITRIQLALDDLIIVFRNQSRSLRFITVALQLISIKTLFGSIFLDDLTCLDISHKWHSITSKNTLLNQAFCVISVTSYSIISHHMLVKNSQNYKRRLK